MLACLMRTLFIECFHTVYKAFTLKRKILFHSLFCIALLFPYTMNCVLHKPSSSPTKKSRADGGIFLRNAVPSFVRPRRRPAGFSCRDADQRTALSVVRYRPGGEKSPCEMTSSFLLCGFLADGAVFCKKTILFFSQRCGTIISRKFSR